MWIILVILIFIFLWYRKTVEGLSGSPYEMVQEQVGNVQHIKEQLDKITFNNVIVALQQKNDTMTNDINTFQANIPPKEVAQYS